MARRWAARPRGCARWWWMVLGCAFAAGCGQDLRLGSECRPGADQCAVVSPNISGNADNSPGGACFQAHTEPQLVEPGQHVEFCQLVTLKTVLGAGVPAYAKELELIITGGHHHVFVERMAASAVVGEWPDGEVDCAEAVARGDFQPLFGSTGYKEISFPDRGYGFQVAHGDRLLFSMHYLNTTDEAVEVDATLNLTCESEEPSVFVQQFAFESLGEVVIPAGQGGVVSGRCQFDKATEVSLIYRRTHPRLMAFEARRVPTSSWRWRSTASDDWVKSLQPWLELAAGEGLEWECEYVNEGDEPLRLGAGGLAACGLMGFYQLADGSQDPAPERCSVGAE